MRIVLSLRGIQAATIRQVDAWRENETIVHAIHRLASPLLEAVTDERARNLVIREFCITLNGGLFSRLYFPEDKNSPDYDLFLKTVVKILTSDELSIELSTAQRTALENAEKYLRGRARLFWAHSFRIPEVWHGMMSKLTHTGAITWIKIREVV